MANDVDILIVWGDTETQLLNIKEDGSALDLSDYDAGKFTMKADRDGSAVIDTPITIATPKTLGQVTYGLLSQTGLLGSKQTIGLYIGDVYLWNTAKTKKNHFPKRGLTVEVAYGVGEDD